MPREHESITGDDSARPRRRALTKTGLQAFFDAANDIVETEFAKDSNRLGPGLHPEEVGLSYSSTTAVHLPVSPYTSETRSPSA